MISAGLFYGTIGFACSFITGAGLDTIGEF
jgi:hypothetical protein